MSDVLADLYAEWTWRNRVIAAVYRNEKPPGYCERGPHSCTQLECADQNQAYHRVRRVRQREAVERKRAYDRARAAAKRVPQIVRLHGAERGPHRCKRPACAEQNRAENRLRMRQRRGRVAA